MKCVQSSMDPSMYRAATIGDGGSFFQRIRDGNVSIDDLLSNKTPKDNNVLHLAAEFEQINFFKDIPLDKQSPLFWASNKMGDTPMHIAARVGCDELVNLLIENAKSQHIQTTGDQEMGPTYSDSYKELLRKTNLEMHTALHVAARYGHRGVVTLLMKEDPELCRSTYSSKESPLFLATCKEFSDIACDILNESSSISPSFQGSNGVTALHAAVTHTYPGVEGIVEIMVSKYPEMIKNVDALGWTPLHYAAFSGNLKAIKLLMQFDVYNSSYILDTFGMSALHVAAYKGHIEVMNELIQYRPDTCECLNTKDQTILHVAILSEQINVVEYIMNIPEFKMLIDQADKEGNTPLNLAVTCGNREIIRTLTLDCGVENTTVHQESPLVFDNVLRDSLEIQEIFSDRGRSFGVPLFQEQINRDFKKLKCCPEENPNEKGNSETSAVVDIKENLNTDTNPPKKKKNTDTNLLIATLIATVTFTAALAPPGGYGDDGKPILRHKTSFKWFQAFNTMSFSFSLLVLFYASITAYNIGSRLFPFKPGSLILVSLYGMCLAFGLGSKAAATDSNKLIWADSRTILVNFVSLFIALFPDIVRKTVKICWNASGTPRSGSATA